MFKGEAAWRRLKDCSPRLLLTELLRGAHPGLISHGEADLKVDRNRCPLTTGEFRQWLARWLTAFLV